MKTQRAKPAKVNTLETILARTIEVDGCLVWAGYKMSNGYGLVSAGGKRGLVHRIVWKMSGGHLPDDMTIDHLCRTKACINVAHMEVVTGVENSRRAGGLEIAHARARAKTHCKHGHEFTPENTYIQRNGGRGCRRCKNDAWRRRAVALGLRRPEPGRIPGSKCGTRSGYVKHQRLGESCEKCKAANTEYAAKVRARKRAEAAVRALIVARSSGYCELRLHDCMGVGTDLAHRIGRKMGGRPLLDDLRASNALFSCRRCHSWCHDRVDEARDLGFMLKEGQDPTVEPVAYQNAGFVVLDDLGYLWPVGE
jgi:hypothetical protein